LVHVSQLADRFVKDAHEVVKAGDVVKVRVVDIDIPRKRIGLSMRQDAVRTDGEGGAATPDRRPHQRDQQTQKQDRAKPIHKPPAPQGALAAALAEALKRK
jgi:uncharacterized protein